MSDPTYPLDFPSTIKLNGVTPTLAFVNSNSISPFTFERQAFRWDGEQWQFQYTTPPMLQEDADEWIAFANKLRGSYGTFLLGDKSRGTPKGIGGGTPLVRGGGQTGYALDIDGAPTNTTGWLVKGDGFQVGTGATARLHKLVEDADVDAMGRVTLNFVPKLRYSPADNAPLVIQDPVGVFYLMQNSVAWSVDSDGFYHYIFSAAEAL